MTKVNEIWLPINGTDGAYEISNTGLVRSRHMDNGLKKLQLVNGYLMVPMKVNKIKKLIKVHRLVASYFIPRPDGKNYVNHIDGNKRNNHVDNLEWCTHQENMQHAYSNRLRDNRGTGNPSAKLSNEDVVSIYKSKLSCAFLSAKHNVSISTISRIKRGEKWTHLTSSL